MHYFNFNIKKAIILIIVLVIIPLYLITLGRSKIENISVFRFLTYSINKLQTLSYTIVHSIHETSGLYLNLINIKRANKALKQENNQLKVQLAAMEEVKQENLRLNDILQFGKTLDFQFTIARVIGRDLISEYQLITVNKGENHNVKKYMIAVNEKGLVGLVFRTLSDSSQIILLTDPMASIPAVVTRSRVHGLVEGTGQGFCQLQYLNNREDVKVGDIVYTSALDTPTVQNFPLGKVTKVQENSTQMTKQVIIEPFIKPSQLEEVLIVTGPESFIKQL